MDESEISVLIVDSDSSFRSTVGFELKSRGYKVAMASNARKALELFPALNFHVIITDIAANTGGTELLQKVRHDKVPAAVILTFADRSLDAELLLSLGAIAAHRKPLAPQLLVDQVRKAAKLPERFHFYLNARRTLTIVSWVGHLRVQDADILGRCAQETFQSNPRFVIMNLHDFQDYDPILAAEIVGFQKKARNLPAELVLCGLEFKLKERLASKGLILEAEVLPTLKDALQFVLKIGMKQ